MRLHGAAPATILKPIHLKGIPISAGGKPGVVSMIALVGCKNQVAGIGLFRGLWS